jgi:tetratricopeptide (TPR) repeat protein
VNTESVELFERPVGTMSLLLFLRRFGPADKTTAGKEIGLCKQSFDNAAERLCQLGFAYPSKESTFPPRKRYGLTRKGEEAADRLLPFADLARGTAASLENELEALEMEEKKETVKRRLQILGMLADASFRCGRWDDALRRAKRGLGLARETQKADFEISALLTIGEVSEKRNELEAAEESLRDAYELARKRKQVGLCSDAALLLGTVAELKRDVERAKERYREASKLADSTRDARRSALARLAEGRLLGKLGDLSESYDVLRDAITSFERLGSLEELPKAYTCIGTTSFRLARPEALEWFEKAIAAALREGDVRIEAHGRANAAAYYIEDRDFRKAEKYLDRADELFQELGERGMFGGIELNRANMFSAMEKWRDAERHFALALELTRNEKKTDHEAHVLFNWGQMEKRRGNRERARELLSKAMGIFQSVGVKDRVQRCEKELAGL